MASLFNISDVMSKDSSGHYTDLQKEYMKLYEYQGAEPSDFQANSYFASDSELYEDEEGTSQGAATSSHVEEEPRVELGEGDDGEEIDSDMETTSDDEEDDILRPIGPTRLVPQRTQEGRVSAVSTVGCSDRNMLAHTMFFQEQVKLPGRARPLRVLHTRKLWAAYLTPFLLSRGVQWLVNPKKRNRPCFRVAESEVVPGQQGVYIAMGGQDLTGMYPYHGYIMKEATADLLFPNNSYLADYNNPPRFILDMVNITYPQHRDEPDKLVVVGDLINMVPDENWPVYVNTVDMRMPVGRIARVHLGEGAVYYLDWVESFKERPTFTRMNMEGLPPYMYCLKQYFRSSTEVLTAYGRQFNRADDAFFAVDEADLVE